MIVTGFQGRLEEPEFPARRTAADMNLRGGRGPARRLFLIGCVLAAASLLAVAAVAEPLRVNCRLAGSRLTDALIQACTELIEKGDRTGDALAEAFIVRGRAYRVKGDYERAIADFSEALKNQPGNALALRGRADAYFEAREFNQSIEDYDRTISRMPNDPTLFQDRARVYVAMGKFERAIVDYSEAIRILPISAPALRERCYVRTIANRELGQAVDDCSEALRLRRNDFMALDRRGLAYLRLGNLVNAMADYNLALRLNPSYAPSLYGRGVVKKKSGDEVGGEADIAAARQIQPDAVDALIGYGIK